MTADLQPTSTAVVRRRAFTTVELLVTLFIIGVLLAITVPAVQNARESSRRTQCKNNLRQLGVAAHAFEATHRHFPPLNYRRHSFLVALLPHLDQTNLFSTIDFDKPWLGRPEEMARLSKLCPALFQCPTDPDVSRQQTDYLGNCGTEGMNEYNGFLTTNGSRTADFKRGLSNTTAASEVVQGAPFVSLNRPFATQVEWKAYVNECESLSTRGLEHSFDYSWYRPGRPCTAFNHIMPIGGNLCVNSGDGLHQRSLVISPSSFHGEGVNVLYCDGAIRHCSFLISRDEWVLSGAQSDVPWLKL